MNHGMKLPAQEWLGYDPERGDMHGYTFEQMTEFGEMIVRESAMIARGYTLEQSGIGSNYTGQVLVQQAILQHFGLDHE